MSFDQNLSSRLQSKTVRQSIISSIARDFNLTKILAEAYFKQISDYFLRHAELTLSTGQLQYLAVDENESAGKRKSARTRKGSPWLRATLIESARAASRSKGTYLGERYHRLAARRGDVDPQPPQPRQAPKTTGSRAGRLPC